MPWNEMRKFVAENCVKEEEEGMNWLIILLRINWIVLFLFIAQSKQTWLWKIAARTRIHQTQVLFYADRIVNTF